MEDRGAVSVAALMAPPFPLILSAVDENSAIDFVPPLARHLWSAGHSVPGVTASPGIAGAFAAEWKRLSGQVRTSEMRLRIHELERVNVTDRRPGHLRPAVASDADLVGRWHAEFQAEAIHDEDRALAEQRARRRLEKGEIYLWEDGESRCMAGRGRPTRHTVTINAPDRHPN